MSSTTLRSEQQHIFYKIWSINDHEFCGFLVLQDIRMSTSQQFSKVCKVYVGNFTAAE